MAAVLAEGRGAVLSHHSAAMLWGLITPSTAWPHVTTASRKNHRRRGIHRHSTAFADDETTIRHGIPVTTVARTLLDLAADLDRHRLERAIAEAEYRRYAGAPSLEELIERYPRRRGVRNLRAILASGNAERGVTRSPLEDRFLRFLDARGLERPELNAPLRLAGELIVVDCMWRRQRVALELDGRSSHLRVGRWEADRLRDRRLVAARWKPARVTTEQLDEDPDGLEADLRAIGIGGQ